jgi:AcrR family transcriptional regulator
MGERGRPRGFDRDTALRRAMETFWRNGYEGTSMTDLTTAMGIASPSIYACFGSKEALFRQAVELYGATEGDRPQRALETAPTARKAVHGMLAANAGTLADPATPPGCMIVLAVTAGTTRNTAVQAFLAERRRDMHTAIAARLRRGTSDGDVPAGTDITAMATFYTTVLQGMSIQARDGASRTDLDLIIAAAMAAWDPLVQRRSADLPAPTESSGDSGGLDSARASALAAATCAARNPAAKFRSASRIIPARRRHQPPATAPRPGPGRAAGRTAHAAAPGRAVGAPGLLRVRSLRTNRDRRPSGPTGSPGRRPACRGWNVGGP